MAQVPALSHCVDRERAEFAGIANRRRWWPLPASAVPDPTCIASATETRNQADGQDE